jgi:hypothetical protein
LFLQNREYYLTERVWKYSEKDRQVRKHIIIDFNGGKGINYARAFPQCEKFIFPNNYLHDLDDKNKILKELKSRAKEIINNINPNELSTHKPIKPIMASIREIQANGRMIVRQREGIKNGLKNWLERKDTLGRMFDGCFKCFFPEIIRRRDEDVEKKPIPIFRHESALQFLFMFQNIAIFCPEVKVLHLYSYISVNKKRKSSLSFFFKNQNMQLSRDDEIFNILSDIESAFPDIPTPQKTDIRNFPLWNNAFNRLPEKEQEIC